MIIKKYIFLLLVICCISCKDDRNARAVETLIQSSLEERLAEYERILMKKCQDEMLEEASRIVDSILITEARLSRDTVNRPRKPPKPERPEVKTAIDSTPIAPFIKPERDSGN